MIKANYFVGGVHPGARPARWKAIFIAMVFLLTSLFATPAITQAETLPALRMYLAAPSAVTATSVSISQINLAWMDISSNETGYSIERRKESESFTQIASVPANTRAYSDSGLTAGTFYTYRLKAIGNGSNIYDSAYSNEVTAKTYYEVIVTPGIPGTPSRLTATTASSSQINLVWIDESDNETGFSIERKTGSGSFAQISIVAANTAAFADSGLAAATTYTYRVKAVGNGSNVRDSGYSNAASAQTHGTLEVPIQLEAPSNLAATAISTSQINLLWIDQSNNEFGYSIERQVGGENFGPIDSVLANISSYVDSGLAAGTTYTYRVKAYGNGSYVHNSEYSNEASATTKTAPAAQKVLRFYIGKSDYFINDQIQTMDTVPITPNGRTMLPVTHVALPLGAIVYWNGAEQKVTITNNSTTIEMWIGLNIAMVNGVATPLDPGNSNVVPIVVAPGRTMLPLKFIAENLNCQVDWDAVQEMVTVTYPKI